MNNDTHMSRCIDSITVTKDVDHCRRTEELHVSVTLKREAVIHCAIQTPDRWVQERMTAEQAHYMAEHRRRDIAHQISRHFAREIEGAVARLDAATLVGETVTLRRSR